MDDLIPRKYFCVVCGKVTAPTTYKLFVDKICASGTCINENRNLKRVKEVYSRGYIPSVKISMENLCVKVFTEKYGLFKGNYFDNIMELFTYCVIGCNEYLGCGALKRCLVVMGLAEPVHPIFYAYKTQPSFCIGGDFTDYIPFGCMDFTDKYKKINRLNPLDPLIHLDECYTSGTIIDYADHRVSILPTKKYLLYEKQKYSGNFIQKLKSFFTKEQ